MVLGNRHGPLRVFSTVFAMSATRSYAVRGRHLGQRGGTSWCGLMRRSKHRARMHNSKRVLSASTSGELNASGLILSEAASTETPASDPTVCAAKHSLFLRSVRNAPALTCEIVNS